MNWIKINPSDKETWPVQGKRVLLFNKNHPWAGRSVGYSYEVGRLERLNKEYWFTGDRASYLLENMDIVCWADIDPPDMQTRSLR